MSNPAVNQGIENVRKYGSGIFRAGTHMLPSVSLMMAEGVLKNIKDLKKPFVTIINSYTNQIPGHAHLEELGHIVKKELESQGVNVWYANIGGAICDGIAMGHFGMKYSLASRELITDQIETIIGAHPCDAWIAIGNCDKIVPAMYNAMARINIPSIYVSGGPMLAGSRGTDLISVFEGVGEHSAGKMKKGSLERLTSQACPSFGSCSGMFTANSMNCLGEALGFALPGNGTITATVPVKRKRHQYKINPKRIELVKKAAQRLLYLLKKDLRPLDILKRHSIDNAFILDLAMGGSTNTVLHTLAFAHEAGIHQDGVLKERRTYEIMRPQDVGIPSNNLVLGKHSGRHALFARLKNLGYKVSAKESNDVFSKFKILSDKKKVIFDDDLIALVEEGSVTQTDIYSLDYITATSGTGIVPTATVRIVKNDKKAHN